MVICLQNGNLSSIYIALIFFIYSGPSGILGSERKQNTAKAGASGHENCYTFHLFSSTDSIKPSLLFSNIVGYLYF